MNNDPSQPLDNAMHEAFACELAKGKSQLQAYIAAGYSEDTAKSNAWRLMENEGIIARKTWLQKQAADKVVLSLAEKRDFLARVVRAQISETPDDSDLWQEIIISEDSIKRKMPSKIEAIKLDNDMAPDVEAKPQTVRIVIGQ